MLSVRHWRIVRNILIWRKAWKWTRFYLRSSGVFPADFDSAVLRARLRKEAHAIEKGLSLPKVRSAFGQAKIVSLLKDIEVARQGGGLDEDVENAQDVLRSYVEWHANNDCTDPFIASVRDAIPSERNGTSRGGVMTYPVQMSAEVAAHFDEVVLSRRSLRNFSTEIVPAELIEDAIRVAWYSPSVCNRQPWAVALVQSPDLVRRLLGLQAGNRGFEQTITNLLVVLADTKAFVEDYEIFEPFVDAGILSGALVNALHARNIGSCCLNLCVSHAVAEKIIKTLEAPGYLFPVLMIACGYAAEGCEVAMSTRGPIVILRR